MAFKDFPEQHQAIRLLQRSLERGRLGHAYLFSGHQLDELEGLASSLAKTLNCQQPQPTSGRAIDCCDHCLACQKIDHRNHSDVYCLRPESKTRIIKIEQIRELIQEINLKPTEGAFKVAIIVAADRLKTEAANAFLKTLEEPPANSIFILLTTDASRILETIVSRCLRLNFAGSGLRPPGASQMEWLSAFSEMAAIPQKSLFGRYRLADVLLQKLNATKSHIEEALTASSPLQKYPDVDKELAERWEDELAAAIEAEYRLQRADLLGLLHWWFRDVWRGTLGQGSVVSSSEPSSGELVPEGLRFPGLKGTGIVAGRLATSQALENLEILEQLQRWLYTNVQEALALEVALLKLKL